MPLSAEITEAFRHCTHEPKIGLSHSISSFNSRFTLVPELEQAFCAKGTPMLPYFFMLARELTSFMTQLSKCGLAKVIDQFITVSLNHKREQTLKNVPFCAFKRVSKLKSCIFERLN
jgi:hypothetical protein